jgi:hypothetical protein
MDLAKNFAKMEPFGAFRSRATDLHHANPIPILTQLKVLYRLSILPSPNSIALRADTSSSGAAPTHPRVRPHIVTTELHHDSELEHALWYTCSHIHSVRYSAIAVVGAATAAKHMGGEGGSTSDELHIGLPQSSRPASWDLPAGPQTRIHVGHDIAAQSDCES